VARGPILGREVLLPLRTADDPGRTLLPGARTDAALTAPVADLEL
jgi:hypothetical protein